MSGFPRRSTCLKLPDEIGGSGEFRSVSRGRDVVAHTPIVAAGELGGSMAPVRVSIAIGISIAIAFTEKPDRVSDARLTSAASSAAERIGGDFAKLNVS